MKSNGTLGIIIALSMAMLGAAIVVSYGALQAEALKSGTAITWCYTNTLGEPCFNNHGDCTKAQQSDATADSGCFKKKITFG